MAVSINSSPITIIEPVEEAPISSLPFELLSHVFCFLDCKGLAKACQVSRLWNECSRELYRKKEAVYKTLAFGKGNWMLCGGAALVAGEDEKMEINSLPNDIVKILNSPCPVFPMQQVKETHMLFRVPKGLSINKIGILAKEYPDFGNTLIEDRIVTVLGDKEVECSYWVLMTMDVLPGSRDKNYTEQKEMVGALAQKKVVINPSSLVVSERFHGNFCMLNYEVPKTIEAICGIFAKYFTMKISKGPEPAKRLFIDNPTLTRCQDVVGSWQVTAGLTPGGLFVHALFDDMHLYTRCLGIAALRKFYGPSLSNDREIDPSQKDAKGTFSEGPST